MICVIPAKADSERSFSKNFAPFASTTLVDWACEQGVRSGLKVYVSTNNKDYQPQNQKVTVVARPDFLASDNVSSWDVIEHLTYMLGYFGKVVLLQPTSPLRTVDDIVTCIGLSAEHNQNVTATDKWGNPNGAVYVRAWKKWSDKGIEYKMPWCRGADIDLATDFEAAEQIVISQYAQRAFDQSGAKR